MTDLTERADAERDKLAKLREWRGTALLDNQPVSHGEIIDARETLDGLADAEGEAVRRARELARQALDNIRGRIMVEISENEAARVAAAGQAEKATRALHKALTDAKALQTAQRGLWKQVGDRVPDHIQANYQERRLSDYWLAVMGGGFGLVAGRASWLKPEADWADAERIEGEKAFAVITKRKD